MRKNEKPYDLKSPAISVVMPVYNMEEYVAESVGSILNQTFSNWELIIVDDGSTDGTAEILRSFTDSRIRVLTNFRNKGNYPARNRGCRLAKGKYIAVMDADDVCYPNRLQVQYDYLEAHPDVLLVGSGWHFMGGLDRNVEVLTDYEDIKLFLLDNSCFLHPSVMLRSEVMRAVGGYDEHYMYAGDYDLLCRLALRGKIENIPDRLVAYRWHPGQITQAHRSQQRLCGEEARRNYHRRFVSRYRTGKIKEADEYDVGLGALGECICLYVYAIYTGKQVLEERADDLLDYIVKHLMFRPYGDRILSLCQLGCGILCLLRNGFVEGDEKEVLEEIDWHLEEELSRFPDKSTVVESALKAYKLKRSRIV